MLAIERHPHRLRVLRERFPHVVTVIDAHAADRRLPRRPFHVVANPPFAVSSSLLLRRLLHPGSRLLGAQLVLPESVARR